MHRESPPLTWWSSDQHPQGSSDQDLFVDTIFRSLKVPPGSVLWCVWASCLVTSTYIMSVNGDHGPYVCIYKLNVFLIHVISVYIHVSMTSVTSPCPDPIGGGHYFYDLPRTTGPDLRHNHISGPYQCCFFGSPVPVSGSEVFFLWIIGTHLFSY